MTMNNNRNPLLFGAKLGIQSVIIAMCCSPLLVVIHLYVDALERNVEYWNLSRIPIDLYCFGGPMMILLWFSLPYILGEIVFAFLNRHPQNILNVLLGSVITGLAAGAIGNWLMANFFLTSSLRGLHFSDWVLIGLMEAWSILVFVWVGFRANRNLTLSRRKSDT